MMYKSSIVFVVTVLISASSCADSVEIYGLLDAGLTSYSNVANGSGGKTGQLKLDTGVAQSNRLGFKEGEDLGPGQQAFFVLETGFNLDDGSLAQGGLLFGRQSYLGISDKTRGTLSVGRQYDFMSQLGSLYAMGSQSAAGALAWGIHADAAGATILNDHVYNADRTNNAIKYNSVAMNGVSFGLMYGLGEVAGNAEAGRTISARASYDAGPLSIGAAYTVIDNVTGLAHTRIYGIGAHSQLGRWKPFALLTHVEASTTGAAATTYDAGLTYALTKTLDASAGYMRQDRNMGVDDVQQFTAALDFRFSRRTDVYLACAANRDRAHRSFPVYSVGVQSASGQQDAFRIGMRHVF